MGRGQNSEIELATGHTRRAQHHGADTHRTQIQTQYIVGKEPKLDYEKGSLVMMAGASGLGKSTFANKHFPEAKILSADAIRGELFGDESVQKDPRRVFSILHQRVRKALADGETVVVDVTGFNGREDYTHFARQAQKPAHMVLLYGTLQQSIDGQKSRERKVPEEVLQKQHQSATKLARSIFHKKLGDEGFTSIAVVGRDHVDNATVNIAD